MNEEICVDFLWDGSSSTRQEVVHPTCGGRVTLEWDPGEPQTRDHPGEPGYWFIPSDTEVCCAILDESVVTGYDEDGECATWHEMCAEAERLALEESREHVRASCQGGT